jgi:hypothetical protein
MASVKEVLDLPQHNVWELASATLPRREEESLVECYAAAEKFAEWGNPQDATRTPIVD